MVETKPTQCALGRVSPASFSDDSPTLHALMALADLVGANRELTEDITRMLTPVLSHDAPATIDESSKASQPADTELLGRIDSIIRDTLRLKDELISLRGRIRL